MVSVAQRKVATLALAVHLTASAVLQVASAAPPTLTARLNGMYLCLFAAVILLTPPNSQVNFRTCK
jgi:hypothetical protein